jgi:hypothetical protein
MGNGGIIINISPIIPKILLILKGIPVPAIAPDHAVLLFLRKQGTAEAN